MGVSGGLDLSKLPAFRTAAPVEQEPERSPFRAGLVRVGAELSNNIPLAVEKAIGTLTPEKEAEYQAGLRRGIARSDALLPGGPMSIGQVHGIRDVGTLINENFRYSLPQMAASIGGALVARGRPFTGATVAGTPFFVGSNISRATEEGTKPLSNDALVRSVAVAPAQALADTAAERFLPFARGIFGKGAATQTGGFLTRTGKSIAKAGAAEAVTETAQQAGERYAAGLVLSSPEATREYVQSFGTAFFVGGALGAFGGIRSPQASHVSSPNAPIEELQSVVDDVVMPTKQPELDLNPPVEAFPSGFQPSLFGNSYEELDAARRPLKDVPSKELATALNATNSDQETLDAIQRELKLRHVNNSAIEDGASAVTEAVERSLSGQSGGAVSDSSAPASIPWENERDGLLKGIATRKWYREATSPDELDTILRARLEGGSTAKSDLELAKRRGIDLNEPAASVEATEPRVQAETGAAAPVAIDRATPAPAAPANLEGGDQPVDPEFEAWWKGRKKGRDKAVRALKPTSYEDLDQQIFRELGEPRNTETLFSKSNHLEELAADERIGILDKEGNLTEKGLNMAVAQGIVPSTINEAQSQEIMRRRATAQISQNIPETAREQQLVNQAIDEEGFQPAQQEGNIAELKRMVRDGDISGAMMGLQRVRRGESLFAQPERQEAAYTGGERASGVVNRERVQSARLAVQDQEATQKIKTRKQAEKAIQHFELSQSIDAAVERGDIDRKEQLRLVSKLRQGRFAEVANAVPVVKPDPRRATLLAERINNRSAAVTDLMNALRDAMTEAEVPELDVDENGVFKQEQVKVARRDFLAGVAASVAVGLPTNVKAATDFKPLTPALEKLLENGNPTSILTHIKQSSADPSYRLLAAKLLRGDWSKVNIIVYPYDSDTVRGESQVNDDGSTTVTFYGKDGRNEQTVLHELIHAYVQQRWAGISVYTAGNRALLKDTKDRGDTSVLIFQSVWERIGYVLKERGLVQSALDGNERDVWAMASYEDPDEMLSWVLTNPDAQAFLKSVDNEGKPIPTPKPKNAQSLWDRIVQFFADMFGVTQPKVKTALDDVLGAGYAVIDAGADVQPGDFNVKIARRIAERRNVHSLAKGGPRSALAYNAQAKTIVGRIDEAFDNVSAKPLKVGGLKALVGAMPLTHMVKHYIQELPALKLLFDAHAARRATTAVFAHLYDTPKTLSDRLSRAKDGKKILGMINEVMELTAQDIDPTKPWEQNDHLHGYDNAPTLRRLHEEGHRKYNLLKGSGNHVIYDAYRQLNEMEHYASMALGIRQLVASDITLLSNMPRFEVDPTETFRNDSRYHSPVEARKYWRDELNAAIAAAGDYIDGVRGTAAETESTRLSPLETYLREVKKGVASMDQAPYFHLGRHGAHFVTGQVRLGDDKKVDGAALEHVARELEKIGIHNARVSKDLIRPTVYLRIDKIGQRDEIAKLFVRLQNEGWLDKKVEVKAGERDAGEWLPERTQREMKKFVTALKGRFEPTDDMNDEERAAAKKLQSRMETIAYDVWLNMLPDSATSKVLTHRESKPGYDKDMARNFAFRYNIGVNSLASMAAEPHIDQAFTEMRGRVNEAKVVRNNLDVDTITTLYGEMAKREENLSRMSGDTSFDKWRALTHSYFLGFSPSYALVNLTQIPVLLWPELAKKHGFVGAAKAIAKVTPLAFRIMSETFKQGKREGGLLRAADTILTPEVLKAAVGDNAATLTFLQNMVGSGIIDIGSAARELGTVAEGTAGSGTGKYLRYSASLGLYSETVSRLIAALAARELHKGGDPVEYAKDVVRESMLEYSNYNSARLMGKMGLFGPFTPVMTQFMQYSTQVTFKLYREAHEAFGGDKEAQKFLLGHLSMVTALAGTLGMPFATAAAWALEKLVDGWEDDEDPFDATAAWRNAMAGIFGKELGEMVSRGVPRAGGYGFDISQRVGEQNLLPFSQWLTDKREFKDASAEAALRSLGAPVSMAVSIAQGLGKMAEGDILGGMAMGVPTSIKGPSKAFQMYVDGYKDTKGNKLPMTPKATAYLAQLMGVNPAEKAEYSEQRGDEQAYDTVLKKRAGVLRDRISDEIMSKDMASARDTFAEIEKFNQENPAYKVDHKEIEVSINRRMKLQAISEATGTPLGTNPKDLKARERFGYANIDYQAQR